MTKEEAIQLVENAFNCWESEFKTIDDDWSYEHEARDMAIEALKRDDPKVEFQKHFEASTICGYSAKEIALFADACRRCGITEAEMHQFLQDTESLMKYVMEKFLEDIEGRLVS